MMTEELLEIDNQTPNASDESSQDRPDFDGEYDYAKEYADEYYEDYISQFEQNKRKRLTFRFFKRLFDFVVSLIMLLVLSPVFLILAIAVKCDSKGPAIFKQKRMGRNGKIFSCYKFRSMYIEAPSECATSRLENPDQYLTRVGKFLRRLSLDELPQLWCVLIGTMSFIGYRPLILSEEKCNEMRRRLGVFALRPGISGYAQVKGRDDVYYKNKALMDAYYVKHASLWFDLKLLVRTLIVIVRRDGNHSDRMERKKKN